MSDLIDPFVQRGEARNEYVKQHINEAYEQIRDDLANPPVQPEIQLKEGWRNGNIKISDTQPTDDASHTWDIWLEVPSGSIGWTEVTKVHVRMPE